LKRAKSFRVGGVVLIAASALLIATVALGLLAVAKMGNESRAENEFLTDSTLDQSSSMNRVLIAAIRFSEALDESDGKSTMEIIEKARLLASHASIPPFISEETFKRFIKDDPLLIGPQLKEAEDSYRESLSVLESDIALLESATTTAAEAAAVARTHDDFLAFMKTLEKRSHVMTQLEGTYHAQLRSAKEHDSANIAWIISMQGSAAVLAILMAYLSLRDQSRRIKVLSGLIPICAKCKKVRDDKGYWTQVEAYVRERSEAEFTHGICPQCADELYPGYSARKKAAALSLKP
jgi:hypothetical protein